MSFPWLCFCCILLVEMGQLLSQPPPHAEGSTLGWFISYSWVGERPGSVHLICFGDGT